MRPKLRLFTQHSWGMTPQYPDLPPPQPHAAPAVHLPPSPRRRSPIDIIVTAVMSAVAVLAAFGSLWYSLLFAMATDSCGTQCNDVVLASAYLVTWGGVATAGIGAIVGMVVAARHGWVMWVWPTLALCLIVASLVIGAYLASSVMHHS